MLIEALKGRKDRSVIHPPNKLGSLLTEVDKNSDIEAFVVREIDHIAKKPDNKPNFYDKSFLNFEDISDYNQKHEEIDVWSSKEGCILECKPKESKK